MLNGSEGVLYQLIGFAAFALLLLGGVGVSLVRLELLQTRGKIMLWIAVSATPAIIIWMMLLKHAISN